MSDRSFRTPLKRVRSLGSARNGTHEFWWQRLTGLANIPLSIGAILIIMSLINRNHAAAVQVLALPLVAVVLLLFIVSSAYHMWIGMQVVIEDYVHGHHIKLVSLLANTFFCAVVGLISAYAVLKISFGV